LPNIKSAKKRVKVTEKKRLRNKQVKTQVKSAIKRFDQAIANQNPETAKEELNHAKKVIDKAVSKGVIHKNNAARKKSQLATKFNDIAS